MKIFEPTPFRKPWQIFGYFAELGCLDKFVLQLGRTYRPVYGPAKNTIFAIVQWKIKTKKDFTKIYRIDPRGVVPKLQKNQNFDHKKSLLHLHTKHVHTCIHTYILTYLFKTRKTKPNLIFTPKSIGLASAPRGGSFHFWTFCTTQSPTNCD
jgi:hypothetical protein